MKIKRIKTCATCEADIATEVLNCKDREFETRCNADPASFYMEEGLGYSGVWLKDDQECIECK